MFNKMKQFIAIIKMSNTNMLNNKKMLTVYKGKNA